MTGCYFEKVSETQFARDCKERLSGWKNICKYDYNAIVLPVRSTAGSAGYDFVSPVTFTLFPGESMIIPSGIRCHMKQDVFLAIVPRSSVAVKHGITLLNTVAIIDSDYYNAENEGHIMMGFKNTNNQPWMVSAGDRVCQGIFLPYLVTDNDGATGERVGGVGSTGV